VEELQNPAQMASAKDWLKRLIFAGAVGAAKGAPERSKWGDRPPEQEQTADQPKKPGEQRPKPDGEERTE
jgi:hypothetical protein